MPAIAPGDPFRSVLLYRMSKLGGGRMPHIASTEVDRAGVQLMYEWIQQLPSEAAKDKTGDETAGQLRQQEATNLERLLAAKLPEQTPHVESLLSTTSGALMPGLSQPRVVATRSGKTS